MMGVAAGRGIQQEIYCNPFSGCILYRCLTVVNLMLLHIIEYYITRPQIGCWPILGVTPPLGQNQMGGSSSRTTLVRMSSAEKGWMDRWLICFQYAPSTGLIHFLKMTTASSYATN